MAMIGMIYFTLIPVIFGGMMNMLWCKKVNIKALSKPLDNGKCLKDGNRVFGDNKTYNGVVGMMTVTMVLYVIFGFICNVFDLNDYNIIYEQFDNTVLTNILFGLLFGFTYIIFELPNSFIKRRIGIKDGKTSDFKYKKTFIFIDQIDSIIGLLIVLYIIEAYSIFVFIACIVLGGITHILINMLLYKMKLRKNMF